MTMTTV